MARRKQHSRDELREMAIDAAVAILNKRGLASLSTRNVAKAIGYTVGTLYLVFQNLDELILHVNAATLRELERSLADALVSQRDPAKMISAIAHRYYGFARDNHACWSLLFTHRLPAGQPVPAWYTHEVLRLFSLVREPLQRLAPQIEPLQLERTVHALWGGVHGVCALGLSDKLQWDHVVDTEQVIGTLVDNLITGFVNPRG